MSDCSQCVRSINYVNRKMHREKNTLEPKAECYANDKVKSPPVFRSLYDDS